MELIIILLPNCGALTFYFIPVNPTLERSHSVEFSSNDTSDSSRPSTSSNQANNLNGFNRYTNGQKIDSPPTRAAANSSRIQNVINTSGRAFPTANAPLQGTVAPAASPAPPPAATTPAFPQYHPGIPPPPFRPYYPNQPYASPTSTST